MKKEQGLKLPEDDILRPRENFPRAAYGEPRPENFRREEFHRPFSSAFAPPAMPNPVAHSPLRPQSAASPRGESEANKPRLEREKKPVRSGKVNVSDLRAALEKSLSGSKPPSEEENQ